MNELIIINDGIDKNINHISNERDIKVRKINTNLKIRKVLRTSVGRMLVNLLSGL